MSGVHEEAVAFCEAERADALAGTPFEGAQRFRRFGDCGPMYEVLSVEGDRVRVWLSNSDEETVIRFADAAEDPQAH